MKKALHFILLFSVVVMFLFAAGCAKGTGADMAYEDQKGGYTEDIGEDSSAILLSSSVSTERMRIITAEMSIETRQFDSLIEALNGKVSELGGYIDSSRINNYNENYRYAEFVYHIPAGKTEEVVNMVGSLGTVKSYSENAEDVTNEYIDTESRINALKGERDALQAMLEKAESTSELIEIRKQLTETISELESYQSRLNSLNQSITYSTLTVDIDEVDRESLVADKGSFFSEVKTRFANSLSGISYAFRSIAIFVLGNILYLLIAAAIATGIVFLLRWSTKRNCK